MNDLNLKKQMPKNLVMNGISFCASLVAGVWLVPYLVSYLGKAAYGLIPLAMAFTEYISIITQSLNAAINRYLVIALQQDNKQEAREVFNTSLMLLIFFIIIQIPLMILCVYDLSTIISIPEELLKDARWLFGLTFGGFLISLVQIILTVSMFSQNRLDLIRMNDIIRVGVRISLIIILFTVDTPKLIWVGAANACAEIAVFISAAYFWKKLTPELIIHPKFFKLSRVKELSSMGGWLLINQIGFLLFLRVDIFIINRFIGPERGGEYAAVLQWSVLIRRVAGVLSGVISPVVMIYYARGEMERMINMVKTAVKFLSITMAIPLAILCVCSNELISIWLGEGFEGLGFLLILMLFHLIINLGVLPLFPINTSLNKVKAPGIATLSMGIVNFAAAILLIKYTDWGYYGVAAASAFALTAKNGIFTPIYAAKILGIKLFTFYRSLLSAILVFSLITIASLGIKQFITIDSYFTLILAGSLMGIVSFPIVMIILTKNDKKTFIDLVPDKFKKHFSKILFIKAESAAPLAKSEEI